ncbi:MAG: type II 3-dehydroquinate dehydratase [Thermodesulfobacteriota bacterium]
MNRKIMVIHGPNLNRLGTRQPEQYGTVCLEHINRAVREKGRKLGFDVTDFQSNHEGEIVEKIHAAADDAAGLIINPAAFTHTSVAIRDALLMLDVPVVEIHLSNIYKRETFRHHSMIADVVSGQISGFGANGYLLAMDAIAAMIGDEMAEHDTEGP